MSWKFPRKTQFLSLCDVEKKKIQFLRTCVPLGRLGGKRRKAGGSPLGQGAVRSRTECPNPLGLFRESWEGTRAQHVGPVLPSDWPCRFGRPIELLLFGKLLYQKPTSSGRIGLGPCGLGASPFLGGRTEGSPIPKGVPTSRWKHPLSQFP